jgi:hypothetical protein
VDHNAADIVAFLTAQYDAEEKRLRKGWYGDVYWQALDNAAALGGWTAARQLGISVKDCDQITAAALALIRERLEGWQRQEAGPRLADIAAKRKIIRIHVPEDVETGDDGRLGTVCGNCDYEAWPCQTVFLLAEPYADRPGYKEEWRP